MGENISSEKTSRNLVKNTSIIAIGQLSTKIINFFLLPLYTAYLTTEQYGKVDLFMTYGGLLVIIFGLQISQSIFRYIADKRDDNISVKKITSTSLFSSLVMIGVMLFLFFIFSLFESLDFLWPLYLYGALSIAFQNFQSIARGLGKNKEYSFGSFLSALTTIVVNIVLIIFIGLRTEGMIIGLISGSFVGLCYLLLRVKIYKYISFFSFDLKELKKILSFCIPLIPNELSWLVIHASDRIVISNFISLSANGIIAAASKFGSIFTTVFNIFGLAWTEQIVLIFNKEGWKEYINKMFGKLVFIFASFAIVIISLLPIIFPLLVDSSYNTAFNLIPLYLVAVFFNAIIGLTSAIMVADNKTVEIAVTTIIAAIINLTLDLFLVRIIGVFAAPISSIVSYLIVTIWRFFIIKKKYVSLNFDFKYIISLVIMTALSLISCFGGMGINSCIVSTLLILFIFFFVFKNDIKDIFYFIKRRKYE